MVLFVVTLLPLRFNYYSLCFGLLFTTVFELEITNLIHLRHVGLVVYWCCYSWAEIIMTDSNAMAAVS